jgi:guanylate kinase
MSEISNTRPGTLFMLVGPGGVGKNALMQKLIKRADWLNQLPTATTRPPREGEAHGIHHFFITLDEFQNLIKTNALLEYQEVHPGKFYGVPRTTLEGILQKGQQRIADIEFKGAAIIKETYPQGSVAIFIAPPTYDTLIERLEDRKATQAQIDERLARVSDEMLYALNCDYIVVNDDMSDAVDELHAIIQAIRENKTQQASTEVNKTTFTIEVLPMFNDEILTRQSKPILPSATAHKGDDPNAIAAQALENALSITPIASQLSYGVPETGHPVVFNYAPQQSSYALTFCYTYRLTGRITPPEGWEWRPYAEIMGN